MRGSAIAASLALTAIALSAAPVFAQTPAAPAKPAAAPAQPPAQPAPAPVPPAPVPAIAKEKGLELVFNASESGLAWMTPGLDLTADVIKRLDGQAKPAATPKP